MMFLLSNVFITVMSINFVFSSNNKNIITTTTTNLRTFSNHLPIEKINLETTTNDRTSLYDDHLRKKTDPHFRSKLQIVNKNEYDIFDIYDDRIDESVENSFSNHNFLLESSNNNNELPNIPFSEWSALYDFYTSLNGGGWTWEGVDPSHWNFSSYNNNNPCREKWAGIYCNCYNNDKPHYYSTYYYSYSYSTTITTANCSIEKLILINYNLIGTIPSSINQLSNLKILKLCQNEIYGSIPIEISFLRNLVGLALNSNKLIGSIPSLLGQITNLQFLFLVKNQLNGSIPSSLGSLTNLKYLGLYSNKLAGTIPLSLESLTSLESLYLYSNQLTGSILSSLGSLTNLKILDLSNNQINGSIPSSLGSLNNLKYLGLYSNKLIGSIPLSLGSLTNLKILDLSNNQINGSIPSSLGSLNNLESLELYSNQLKGSIPSSLGSLINLQYLDMYVNQLNGSIPSSLGSLINLKQLGLYSNKLVGAIPSSLGSLINLKNFYLFFNHLNGSIPSSLGSLINLEFLYLFSNQLTGSIPSSLGSLVNLQRLYLENNHLSGEIPWSLGLLSNLFWIDLGMNHLTGTIPSNLGNASYTAVISLGFQIYNSSSFTYVQSYDNKFTGPIPSRYCRMIALTAFRMPLSNMTCYPTCLYGKLNDGYLEVANHCPGPEDIAMCDIAASTNMVKIVQTQSNSLKSFVHSPHPIPFGYNMEINISVPNTQSYTINLLKSCQIKIESGDTLSICYGSSYTKSSICPIILNQCNLIPFVVNSSTFVIKYQSNNFYYISYGFDIQIIAKTGYTGWKCGFSSFSDIKTINYQVPNYAPNLCLWTGVYCVEGSVNQITLNGFGVTGKLPPTIGLLKKLEKLNLLYNSLIGTLPSEITDLSALVNLDITSNKLNGTIPRFFNKLTKLNNAILAGNYFSGTIPITIGTIESLKSFDIRQNLLSGQITSPLCEVSRNITILVSGNNQIGCYQPCGDSPNSLQNQLPLCVPTQQPTVVPYRSAISDSNNLIIPIACSVGGAFLIFVVAFFIFMRRKYNNIHSKELEEMRKRRTILLTLPIHSFLLSYCEKTTKDKDFKELLIYSRNSSQRSSELIIGEMSIADFLNELIYLIDKHTETFGKLDYNGRSVIDIVLEFYERFSPDRDLVISRVLQKCLPIRLNESSGEIEQVDVIFHGYAWLKVVSSSLLLLNVVETILDDNPSMCQQLSKACDVTGRSAVDVAIPECQQLILFSLYFFKRFEIITSRQPHYQSLTCIVHIAIDHQSESKRQVALKFMKIKDTFLNEILIRSESNFDSQYVIDIIDHFDSDIDTEFRKCNILKGFGNYPYLIVMPMGGRNLNEIVTNGELIEKSDSHFIRTAIAEIARCLNHLHSKGIVHGIEINIRTNRDLKPKNILRREGSFVLIDLDGSSKIDLGYAGTKVSSAFSPPEMIYKKNDADEFGMKQYINYNNSSCIDNNEYKFLPAHPSQDAWALGVTIYYLLASSNIFLCDSVGENICNDIDVKALFKWLDSFKQDKLKKISDIQARNLLSNLLSKDPSRRPTMDEVLHHPFITGKVPSRMIGEVPEFDIFLSYRVVSDSDYVKIFYDKFTKKGLKVWLDQKCLELGKSWEDGFIDGLFKSRIFVPILSREAFVNKNQNILSLTSTSPIDNVLLEYRLAVELQTRHMIDLICPVMIGDYDNESQTFSNYFKSGSHPSLKSMTEVVVDSIEEKVVEILDSQSLGMSLVNQVSVKDIIDNITKNQGCFLEGDRTITIDESVEKIVNAYGDIMKNNNSNNIQDNQGMDELNELTNDNKKKEKIIEEIQKENEYLKSKLEQLKENLKGFKPIDQYLNALSGKEN